MRDSQKSAYIGSIPTSQKHDMELHDAKRYATIAFATVGILTIISAVYVYVAEEEEECIIEDVEESQQ